MLFHYKKARTSQAMKVAINIIIIPVLLYVFQYLGQGEEGFEEIYAIVEKAAIAVVVILMVIFIWFLKSKEQFEIYVTENEFYSHHPTFKEWCFSVNPKDIVSVKNELIVSSQSMSNISVCLQNGRKIQISQNYGFSLNKLYAALKKANPTIALPDNTNVFKRELSEEDDAYVSKRFSVTSKIIKFFLKFMPGNNGSSDSKK
jgi:hypothetical protein